MHAWLNAQTALRGSLASLAALLLLGGLTACHSLRDALGATKNPPDEFAVVTKAPLVIPPEFALRPPEPGAQRPQELEPDEAAQQTVFGLPPAPPAPSPGTSKGEVMLLAKAGADRADPDIRRTINAESLALDKKDKSFTDRVIFWNKDESKSGQPIDPNAEAQRIRENEASGAPVAQGEATTGVASESTGAAGEAPAAEAGKRGGFGKWIHGIWPF
jgi:hypothetical protein